MVIRLSRHQTSSFARVSSQGVLRRFATGDASGWAQFIKALLHRVIAILVRRCATKCETAAPVLLLQFLIKSAHYKPLLFFIKISLTELGGNEI